MNVINVDAHDAQDLIQFIPGSFNNRLNSLVLLKQISANAPEIDLRGRGWSPSTSFATAWVYPVRVASQGSVDWNSHNHPTRLLLTQRGLRIPR